MNEERTKAEEYGGHERKYLWQKLGSELAWFATMLIVRSHRVLETGYEIRDVAVEVKVGASGSRNGASGRAA